MKLETGYIASVHTPFNWFKPLRYISFLIRKVTGFYYNHNFIIYKLYDNYFVVESDIKGVVIKSLAEVPDDLVLKIHKLNHRVEPKRITERIGKTKYDFRSLLFSQLISAYTGIWIGPSKPGKEFERFTCAEFVGWVLKRMEAYKDTPADIFNYCSENGTIVFEGTAKELKQKVYEF